ncbi:hypothetical protein P3T27_007245 [Kitasatospora sp. MAA19]|uniref:hypothetical protein n=1 Tax=Kitasatospora sp. MAA19 TaxID=3035090 RepID=UPI0024768FAC|nr:hypothetical protein [Kitasatospora sp. MAA19]MDH6710495.1 hypothetical protein [Kitasatospora sp. MAA19]
MADLELPADLLPLHVAALRADRAMTTARLAGGDVEAYIGAAEALRTHPIWEQARAEGKAPEALAGQPRCGEAGTRRRAGLTGVLPAPAGVSRTPSSW